MSRLPKAKGRSLIGPMGLGILVVIHMFLHQYIALEPMLRDENERAKNDKMEAMLQGDRVTGHVSTKWYSVLCVESQCHMVS